MEVVPKTADLPDSTGRTRRIEWLTFVPFVAMHLGVLGAWFTGATFQAGVCCVVLYAVRMFGVTAGYHRYFAHRAFKTSRAGQFLLAVLAQSSSQRGVLWCAAHHRTHHRYSDTPADVHSPLREGFWYAHVGWVACKHTCGTDLDRVRDLAKYPELRWLDDYWYLPPVLLGAAVYLTLGWPGFCIGFLLSTVLLWHGTFCINSLAHLCGSRRYATADGSRNSLLLALITLGEGWHNNHHHYMSSARQGFFWWEIDITYYILRGLAGLGLVWDLREPPAQVVRANLI